MEDGIPLLRSFMPSLCASRQVRIHDLKSTLNLSNFQARQHGFAFLPIIDSWIDLLELHLAAVDLEGLVGAVNVGPFTWRDVSPFVLCDRAWCLSLVQRISASEGR